MKRAVQLVLSAFAVAFTAQGAFARECNVSDFRAKDSGTLTEIQVLSYLNSITDSNFKESKRNWSGSGAFAAYSGSTTFTDFKQKLNKRVTEVKLQTYSSYEKDWATSALNDNGTRAYIACIQEGQGFSAVVKAWTPEIAEVSIDWLPGDYGGSIPTPQVSGHNNISNLTAIIADLNAGAWGERKTHRNFPIVKEDPEVAAWLTVSTPAKSITLMFGPSIKVIAPEVENLPVKTIAQKLDEGVQCVVTYTADGTDDYLGTIARGTPYTLVFNKGNGSYMTHGYVAKRGKYQTAPTTWDTAPTAMRYNMWGATFSFTNEGAVESDEYTNLPRKLTGQIICP